MNTAPLYTDIAQAPDGGKAVWVTCSDGVRLRLAYWQGGSRGTVLLFQGRTEYIEKYGPVAARFLERGYSVVAVDFRGQGLSDRVGRARRIGHVNAMEDYQLDVAATLQFVREQSLPEPEVLLSHSMGGGIGLRALHDGLQVKKAIFSAPMWDVQLSPVMRPFSKLITSVAELTGQSGRLAPTTQDRHYVTYSPFEDNTLTNNRAEFEKIRSDLETHPDLELGGPSLRWIKEALRESRALAALDAPQVACLCLLGTNERIVSKDAIKAQMDKWPNGTLVEFPEAEHELLIEEDAIITRVWSEIDAFLDGNSTV